MFKRSLHENRLAGRVLALCARLLGEKRVVEADGCAMTCHLWRGCMYVSKVEFDGE